MSDSERHILASWHANADAWTRAVRARAIPSRVVVTDNAIVAAVQACAPRTVLDVGCGEGWLARALNEHGMQVTGIDAVAALVEQARAAGGADYYCLDYAALAGHDFGSAFDAAVCNFSLFGDASVDALLLALQRHVRPDGHLLIQTLPAGDGQDSGWRDGSWQGFSDDFVDAPPWFCRSRRDWHDVFARTGWQLVQEQMPAFPHNGAPASIIFTLTHG